ncbi:MAG TPA: peptidoglycan editing factor PgeF [Nitrospiraceae bacterium]|nr:peptidoglycan editing factor PgeF [Nitrospiraceae bacterium]
MNRTSIITLSSFASNGDGLHHFFGTRHAAQLPPGEHGNRDVERTGHYLAQEAQSKPNGVVADLAGECRFVAARQVHGTDVLVVGEQVPSRELLEQGWDALITDEPGICLTIKTADCVPVLLFDPVRRVIAAIHAGWRGTLAQIVPKTIGAMRERYGSRVDAMKAAIGPSAASCCYEVDEPVLSRLREVFPAWSLVLREVGDNRAKLDLRQVIRRQAEEAGVRAESISAADHCTICEPDLFYSYRREGSVRGTMISGIALAAR